MNLILIVSDTLRADYLGCYGNPWVRTPNIDRLAGRGVLLEELHAEGLPTIPERIVFATGTYTLPFRGWQPLWKEDVTLSEVLRRQGYTSAFITDVPHYFAPGMNFHRGFDDWYHVRGQEFDSYATVAGPGRSPEAFMKAGWEQIPRERRHLRAEDPGRYLARYLRNVAERREEGDYFTARVLQRSIDWLKAHRKQRPFFMWIDCFDPHEPWDPPERCYEPYAPAGYDGPWLIAPWLISVAASDFTAVEIDHMRALYAAEITFLDEWVGRLLDTVWGLGLEEDTIILFTSDHGTLIGEHGTISKTPLARHTNYRETVRVPGILYHPGGPAGRRVSELTWTPDLMPTLLSLLDVEVPESVHGEPQRWLVTGEQGKGRAAVISGHYQQTYWRVTDGVWSYVSCDEPELYDLRVDPGEQNNVIAEHLDEAEDLEDEIEAFKEQAAALRVPRA
jgi:arylsulfatase A-like enzyme